MKALGFALLLAALVVGGGLLSNYVSRIARSECAKVCPDVPDALKVRFSKPPVELVTCACPVRKIRGVD
jgi:hypothetical protein